MNINIDLTNKYGYKLSVNASDGVYFLQGKGDFLE